MTKLKRKLRNQKGASLIFAVVVMLVVVMVSAVILIAAQSNMSRAKRNQEEQQAYLTVSSAAALVADTLTNGKIYFDVGKATEITYVYSTRTKQLLRTVQGTTPTFTTPEADKLDTAYGYLKADGTPVTLADNPVAKVAAKCLSVMLNYESASAATTKENFTMVLTDGDFSQTVVGEMALDTSYNLIVKLHLDNSGANDPNYYVTMTFNYLAGSGENTPYELMENFGSSQQPVESDPVKTIGDTETTEVVTLTQYFKGYFTWSRENMEIVKGTTQAAGGAA